MRIMFLVVPAVLAGTAVAQSGPNPLDPKAQTPPVEFRSAFEGYRPFLEQELRDWRKANEEVGAAGGHAGHRPGQGEGRQTSKPQPGKPETAGAPKHEGDGAHK
jgi:hypothetical protein